MPERSPSSNLSSQQSQEQRKKTLRTHQIWLTKSDVLLPFSIEVKPKHLNLDPILQKPAPPLSLLQTASPPVGASVWPGRGGGTLNGAVEKRERGGSYISWL
jgi:hypothetical protein